MVEITVNGKLHKVDVDHDTPLLWVIRDELQLTGTKFGCGVAQCGACTVHLNGQPVRSCSVMAHDADGKKVTTIEAVEGEVAEKVINAWEDLNVVQCGYCQSGQIMSAITLLTEKPKPTDEEIDRAMAGNICRCGTYARIKQAIHQAANS